MKLTKASIRFISVCVLVITLPVVSAFAEKFKFDIFSPSVCDVAFLGSKQVSAISPSQTCKIKIAVTKNRVPVRNRKITFSERLTSGSGASVSKRTDSSGNVTFNFKVGESSCYFLATDSKSGSSKNLLLLLNNQGSCGV
jgi:hypothetical protein